MINILKNYYLRISVVLYIFLLNPDSVFAQTAGQESIIEFRKEFQKVFMSTIQNNFYEHEFLRLNGGFLGGLLGLLLVYAISMEIVKTRDPHARIMNLANIGIHLMFVFWIFGEVKPPTRSTGMASYLGPGGGMGFQPATIMKVNGRSYRGSRLRGDYSYNKGKAPYHQLDRDMFYFLGKLFDELSAAYFGDKDLITELFGELAQRQTNFLDAFSYMTVGCDDDICRQRAWAVAINGKFSLEEVERQKKVEEQQRGTNVPETKGLWGSLTDSVSGIASKVTGGIGEIWTTIKDFFYKLISPGWIISILVKVATFFRDLAMVFITLIYAMFLPLTFFFAKIFSVFLVIPSMRSKVWGAYKYLFSWALFGFVSNLTLFIFIIMLDALNKATVESVGALISGGASEVGPKLISIMITNSMFSLAIIVLQIVSISKIPNWCRDLMNLNIDFAVGAGNAILNGIVAAATGVVASGVAIGATSVAGPLGAAGGSLARRGAKAMGTLSDRKEQLKARNFAGGGAAARKKAAQGMAPAGVSMNTGGRGSGGSSGPGFMGGGKPGGGDGNVTVRGGNIDTKSAGKTVSLFGENANPAAAGGGSNSKAQNAKMQKIMNSELSQEEKMKAMNKVFQNPDKKEKRRDIYGKSLDKGIQNTTSGIASSISNLTRAALTGDSNAALAGMKDLAGGVSGTTFAKSAGAGIGQDITQEVSDKTDQVFDSTTEAIADSQLFEKTFEKKVDNLEDREKIRDGAAAQLEEGRSALDGAEKQQVDALLEKAAQGKNVSNAEMRRLNEATNKYDFDEDTQSRMREAMDRNEGFKNTMMAEKQKSMQKVDEAFASLKKVESDRSAYESKMTQRREENGGMLSARDQKKYDQEIEKFKNMEAQRLNSITQGLQSGSFSMDYLQDNKDYVNTIGSKTDQIASESREELGGELRGDIESMYSLDRQIKQAEKDKNFDPEELKGLKKDRLMAREKLERDSSETAKYSSTQGLFYDSNINTALGKFGILGAMGLNKEDFTRSDYRDDRSSRRSQVSNDAIFTKQEIDYQKNEQSLDEFRNSIDDEMDSFEQMMQEEESRLEEELSEAVTESQREEVEKRQSESQERFKSELAELKAKRSTIGEKNAELIKQREEIKKLKDKKDQEILKEQIKSRSNQAAESDRKKQSEKLKQEKKNKKD